MPLAVVVGLLGLGFDCAGLGEVGFDVADDDTLEDADNGFGDRGFGGNGDTEGFGLDVFGLEEEDFFEESCDACLELND